MMQNKPLIGIVGLSDGDPEVHAQLKDIVKAQVDAIVENLRASGQVDVIEAKELVCSVKTAKEQAEYLKTREWTARSCLTAYSRSRISPPLWHRMEKAHSCWLRT